MSSVAAGTVPVAHGITTAGRRRPVTGRATRTWGLAGCGCRPRCADGGAGPGSRGRGRSWRQRFIAFARDRDGNGIYKLGYLCDERQRHQLTRLPPSHPPGLRR